jgi:hypothetical protein
MRRHKTYLYCFRLPNSIRKNLAPHHYSSRFILVRRDADDWTPVAVYSPCHAEWILDPLLAASRRRVFEAIFWMEILMTELVSSVVLANYESGL